MSLTVTLEKIGAELYFVNRSNRYGEPVQDVMKWKVEGAVARVPEDRIGQQFHLRQSVNRHVASIPNGPYGYVELWIGGQQVADIQEAQPIPAPKVRVGVSTRYRNGVWEKELKRGWVAV